MLGILLETREQHGLCPHVADCSLFVVGKGLFSEPSIRVWHLMLFPP